jgi:hypothetical protein
MSKRKEDDTNSTTGSVEVGHYYGALLGFVRQLSKTNVI